MLKIAIAGAGDMARYFTEELLNKSIQVVILTRSKKGWFYNFNNIELRLVDFSLVN